MNDDRPTTRQADYVAAVNLTSAEVYAAVTAINDAYLDGRISRAVQAVRLREIAPHAIRHGLWADGSTD